MNREDCREVLSLTRFDYRYFRRHRRSLLAVFKALRRIPGTISMIQRRRVLAGGHCFALKSAFTFELPRFCRPNRNPFYTE